MSRQEKGETHPYEYYADLARRSPKTPQGDLTDYERKIGHGQFGNNFYLLFYEKQIAGMQPDINKRGIYLPRAEKAGASWKDFLDKNPELLQEIDLALQGIEPYDELRKYHRALLFEGREKNDYRKADEFAALGIEEVGVYSWRKLSTLLEKAARRMEEVGIDPNQFYG